MIKNLILNLILTVTISLLLTAVAIKIINYILDMREIKKQRKAIERKHLIIDIADEIERRIERLED